MRCADFNSQRVSVAPLRTDWLTPRTETLVPARSQQRWQEVEHATFATRVREVGHGERHCAQPVALGLGGGSPFAARETLPGRQCWNPAATGVGRIDGVAKVTGAKLYASDFRAADLPGWPAKTSHAMLIRAARRHARLHRHRPRAPERRAASLGGGDRGRSREDRHPRSRILCRRPVLPGRQDAALSRPAGGAADLREVRRLRSGAARAARRHVREVRRGNRLPSTMPNYGAYRFTRVAGPTPDAPDVYSPLQEGWVSPGHFENTGRPIWAPLPIPTGREYAKAATYGEQIRAELAADNPALLVLDREFETQSVDPMFLEPEGGLAWYDAGAQEPRARARRAVAVRGRGGGRVPSRRSRRGLQAGAHQHAISPMSAAASADATTRRSRSTSRWRRCSFPAARSGSRTTAISSSRRASSGTPFKMRTRIGVDRATGKIRAFAADHVLDGGGLANYSASVATCRRHRRDRHLRHSESRRHHGRAPFARRDRRVDARLRNAADDDGAGGA